jgi:hypothetical protein
VRSLIAVTLVASLALAACSTPAASPAGSSSSTGPAPRPAIATPGPATQAPGSQPPAGGSPTPGFVIPHDDPGLEALLPSEVDGTALLKLSVGPVSSLGVAGAQGLKDVADEIGDGSGNFGLAYAGDPAGAFNLFALRIPGAESSELLTQFAQMTLAETLGGKVESAELGGRDLVHVIDPVSEIGDVWFYAKGDTLLGVQAGSASEATDLLALLQ